MSFKDIVLTPGILPVLITLFMTAFGFGVILPILPFYATSLGATPFILGTLTATFAFMSLVFGPYLGKLGDKVGRTTVLKVGTLCYAAGYLIFAFTHSLEFAFFARALEGIATAAVFPACISLLSDFTSEHQRGRAMGLVSMAFSLGFIVGPALGGLASGISIQAAFLLAALMAFCNFLSVSFQVREPHEKAESRDIVGQEKSLLDHISSPLLFLFLSSAVITFMFGGFDATLALYTGSVLGFTSSQIGLVFTYAGALILIMQFIGSELINRLGETTTIPLGLFMSGLGFMMLVFTHDWVSLLLPLAVFITGNSLILPSVSSLLTKKVTGKRGAVLGLDSSFRSAGQVIGPLFGGFLFGIQHYYAFVGMGIVIWLYMLVFVFYGRKELGKSKPLKSSAK